MYVFLLIASTGFAVVPMATFVTLVWLSNRVDREPLWLVLLSFLWGAIGAVLLALPLNTAFGMFVSSVVAPAVSSSGLDGAFVERMAGPTLGAPLFEEPAKALFLLYVAWNRRPPDMSSGFVYGAALGLGFGMTENLMYFSNAAHGHFGTWATTVLIRTFYSALLHAMASSVVGAAFGFGRLRGWVTALLASVGGLLAAMSLHALWNGLLTLDEFSAMNLRTTNFVLLPLEVLFVLFVYQLCLIDESLAIRRELEDEEDRGLIPPDHASILASWWRRRLQRFVPEGVDRDRYVRTATALARRKRQLKLLGDRATDFYRDDVNRLRRQLELMLAVRTPDAGSQGVRAATGSGSRR